MSATAAALVRTFAVGGRLVTFTFPPVARGQAVVMSVEWLPDAPARLTPDEWAQYRSGRNRACAEFARLVDLGPALVVEV